MDEQINNQLELIRRRQGQVLGIENELEEETSTPVPRVSVLVFDLADTFLMRSQRAGAFRAGGRHRGAGDRGHALDVFGEQAGMEAALLHAPGECTVLFCQGPPAVLLRAHSWSQVPLQKPEPDEQPKLIYVQSCSVKISTVEMSPPEGAFSFQLATPNR